MFRRKNKDLEQLKAHIRWRAAVILNDYACYRRGRITVDDLLDGTEEFVNKIYEAVREN